MTPMTLTTPTGNRPPTALILDERISGALVGAAVGDALGGPVEGRSAEQIAERHGGRVTGIVGPWDGDDWRTARPIAPYYKGDGHVTDDTLMTHALVRVYGAVRDHLDAYSVADHLVPELIANPAGFRSCRPRRCHCNGSSSPRSGSSPGSTTAMSIRARRAPETS